MTRTFRTQTAPARRNFALAAFAAWALTGCPAKPAVVVPAAPVVPAVPVAAAPPSPAQGCDKADISAQVHARKDWLKHCYEAELIGHPELHGTIQFQWTITRAGATEQVLVVADEMASPPLTRCLTDVLSAIHYKPPMDGICVIQWPFVFSPG